MSSDRLVSRLRAEYLALMSPDRPASRLRRVVRELTGLTLCLAMLSIVMISFALYYEKDESGLPPPTSSFVVISTVAVVTVSLAIGLFFAWLEIPVGYAVSYELSLVCTVNIGQFIQPDHA